MDFTDRRRFGLARCERGDLDFRMAQQNTNQLQCGVTRRTQDRNTNHLSYPDREIGRLIESRILAMNSLDRYSAADALCGSLRKGTMAVLMGFAIVRQAFSLNVSHQSGQAKSLTYLLCRIPNWKSCTTTGLALL